MECVDEEGISVEEKLIIWDCIIWTDNSLEAIVLKYLISYGLIYI